ncbi:Insulinase (Peptidase family M16) protein isoform 1 [Hibiscus syriacus]|uniref:Insulinase (Peptidase family M16) protein isoform 1 n=1 Tax=Hibiscus syriacus TaxID=106335 RepID=A0A6A2ZHT6_HIBSY|nr:Insulinase (Peptidase family M16) protein isoform 1 [Hibiscus syriacus]
MEVAKNSKLGTPVKDPEGYSRSKTPKKSKFSENSNPNVSDLSSPLTKSSKHHKHSAKNPVIYSPSNKLRERKFVVAKKNKKKVKSDSKPTKDGVNCKCKEKSGYGSEIQETDEIENSSEAGSSTIIKRRRDTLMEEARNSAPEFGKVMHLVQAFERLLSIPNSKGTDKEGEDEKEPKEEKIDNDIKNKPLKWEFPGLKPTNVTGGDTENDNETSFFPSGFVLNAENLVFQIGLIMEVEEAEETSDSVGRIGGSRWKKLKSTSLKPFKLRTERRGKTKEEEFMKKIQEMMIEQEKQRIPIAQGLPWTTDEPEVLIKPPVKESTRPVDLWLHSDVRAEERAEFDHQVAEKMSIIEKYKMERERQQKKRRDKKVEEGARTKSTAQPYFDSPFIPRRSSKNPTIPREPKFHIPQHKKIKCMSWKDTSPFTFQGNEM